MLWNFFGRIGQAVLRFAESVILVRLLLPDGYGLLASVFNVVTLVVTASSFGLENTLLRFFPEAEADGKSRSLIARLASWRLIILCFFAAVLWIFAPFIAHHIWGSISTSHLVRIASLLVFLEGFRAMANKSLMALSDLRLFSLLSAGRDLVYLVLAILFIALGLGVKGAMIASIIASLAVSIWAWKAVHQHTKIASSNNEAFLSSRKVFSYSLWMYTYDLIHFVLGKGMDVLLLTVICSSLSEVTRYVIAFTLAFWALSLAAEALAGGFSLKLMADGLQKEGKEGLSLTAACLFEYLYIFSLPAFAGALVVVKPILILFYGDIGSRAFPVCIILLVGLLIGKTGGITANLLATLDGQRDLVRARVAAGFINLICDLALIPLFGAIGAAIATSIAVTFGIILEIRYVHKRFHPEWPMMFLRKIMIASGIMAAVIWILSRWLGNGFLGITLTILLGVIIYALLLFIIKPIPAHHAIRADSLPRFSRIIIQRICR